MKFKKVEIQAFRAYDKVNDGTFDFTRKEDGKNADFISLYAPNGFGKTSFYDAIEYGVTKNIHRFIKKQKFNQETAKSEKSISSVSKQFILRNRYSEASLHSFIKLTTTDSDEPVTRNISIPSKGGRDYKFDEKETEKKYFKEVILSQEWIDAFLKEDKPEDRYNTFIDYFGDKKIDEYYQKLSNLIGLNNKRIDSLTKELNGIQLELKFDGDKDILKKVNEKIISLNKAGEKLTTIDNSYNESDALNLANKIAERTLEIQFEIKKESEFTKYIDVFVSGNEQVEGVEKYFESKAKIEQLEIKSKEFQELLNKFESLQKKNNEIETLVSNNKKFDSQKRQIEAIKMAFDEYAKVIDNIKRNENDNKQIVGEIEILSLKVENEKKLLSELTVKQNSLQEQISNSENNLSKLPKSKEQLSIIKNKLLEFQNILKDLDEKMEFLEKQKSNLENVSTTLKQTVSNIVLRTFPTDTDLEFIEHADLIKEIEANIRSLKIQEEKLVEVESQIKAQEAFQKEIETFISKGAEIINKNKTNSCPLCEQEYESYTFLASKVSNNKLLSAITSGKIKNRNIVIDQVQLLKQSIRKDSENLTAKIIKKSLTIEDQLKVNNSELSSLITSKNVSLKEIESLNKSLNEILVSTNGNEIDLFETDLKNRILLLKDEYSKLVQNKEILEKGNIVDINKLELQKKNLVNIKVVIDTLYKNEKYNQVFNYFRQEFSGKEISITLIDDNIKSITTFLSDNAIKKKDLASDIKALSEALSSFLKEDIEKQSLLLMGTKDLFVKIVSSFKQEVESKLNISINDFTKEAFKKLLNDKRKLSQSNIIKQEEKIKDFNILSKFKENVTPFLKFEKAKVKEKDTKARIEFLKTKIAFELKTERNKVSEHLTKQINSFFYEGLINDLYKRIDPHPDYKQVKFKCDFSDTKPKLNVCVFQTNEDELIIPNLYFSTAQLNILSLSIFLAKALNAKDESGKSLDCIFIDDPIQSMDSINILSTIDLIRSIVVNQKKQIILSTHDENFHNLLKKKMPTNLFNSKFMELETFGKVKNEVN